MDYYMEQVHLGHQSSLLIFYGDQLFAATSCFEEKKWVGFVVLFLPRVIHFSTSGSLLG
jgi:hypothetical protein